MSETEKEVEVLKEGLRAEEGNTELLQKVEECQVCIWSKPDITLVVVTPLPSKRSVVKVFLAISAFGTDQ